MNRNIIFVLFICARTIGFVFAQEFNEEIYEVAEETDNIEIKKEKNEASEEASNIEFKEKMYKFVGKTNKIELKLDFPLFDFPYQIDTMNTAGYGFFGTYTSPSMNQSLALTMDAYSAMHYGMRLLYDNLTIAPVWKNVIYYGGTVAGFFAFLYVLPFGHVWMQQEYTRSMLSLFDINSYNGSYSILNGTVVTGATDTQLERFKAEKTHKMIRMYESVSEGYFLLSDHLLRNVFFYDLNNLSNWTALVVTLFGGCDNNGIGILATFYGADYVDNDINAYYEKDGGEETRRIAGRGIINWVYDLFRPDEPYSVRGIHPSGNGIARYITWAQLNDDERQYLTIQGALSYLNILSPLYYGFNAFPLGKTGFEWNAAIRHYLTSFGSDTAVQMFLKKEPFNMLFTYHSYTNYGSYFPAIEGELFEFPLQFTPKFGLLISPRVMIGMQPKNQEFKTKEVEFLGLIGLRVDFAVSKHVLPYFDFSAKTNGWVAGNEYLDGNVNIKLGVSVRF